MHACTQNAGTHAAIGLERVYTAAAKRLHVAITGARGFVGRHLCAGLAEAGSEVTAIVRAGGAVEHATRTVVLPFGPVFPREALAGVDAVVHLAGKAHAGGSRGVNADAEYERDNVETTRALAIAAGQARVRRFILASSVKAAAGWSDLPLRENLAPAPADGYGRSKLRAERVLAAMAGTSPMDTIVLRLPLVYGPGVRANVLRLFRAVERGLPLPVGGVYNRRSFIYVENAVAAFRLALAADCDRHEVFYVSDGVDLSTADLARAIGRVLDRPSRIVRVPGILRRGVTMAAGAAARVRLYGPGDIVERLWGSLYVDDTKFRTQTGYSAPVALEDGLAATAHWFRRTVKRT